MIQTIIFVLFINLTRPKHKMTHRARARLERSFNGRFQVSIEQKGKPRKWITLNALRILKRFYAK